MMRLCDCLYDRDSIFHPNYAKYEFIFDVDVFRFSSIMSFIGWFDMNLFQLQCPVLDYMFHLFVLNMFFVIILLFQL